MGSGKIGGACSALFSVGMSPVFGEDEEDPPPFVFGLPPDSWSLQISKLSEEAVDPLPLSPGFKPEEMLGDKFMAFSDIGLSEARSEFFPENQILIKKKLNQILITIIKLKHRLDFLGVLLLALT